MLTINRRRYKPINVAHLEQYLGADRVEDVVRQILGPSPEFQWYGPPILVSGAPGAVYVGRDGDFCGKLDVSGEVSKWDRAEDLLHRMERKLRRAAYREVHAYRAATGFSSVGDLLSEASNGKSQLLTMQKVGPTGVVNVASSLWRLGNLPSAGAAGSAAPGGRALTDATTGALPFVNASGSDTLHFVSAFITSSVAANTLLLYDRIFDVAKTMNSNTTESVTGVPTRYQSSTPGAADYAGGNFCFVEVGGTALAATAHNWTVCQYRNQAGTDAQSFPSMTGNSGAIVDRLDHPAGSWFMPLAAGDTGVMDLAQMQCSAAVATGAINFVIGHPLAIIPCPVANLVLPVDGMRGPFQLARIFDDACLAFLELPKSATTATTYSGVINLVSG
jgi:hypothetical protein